MNNAFRSTILALLVLLPLIASAQSNPPVHVALVSSCGSDGPSAKELALAQVRLSKEPGIALIERAEVERLLEEQHLGHCGVSDPRQALAAGRLLNVDVFAAIETYGSATGMLGLVVFDAVNGVRLSDTSIAAADPEAAADGIVAAVRNACAKRTLLGSRPRTACLLAVRNLSLPREMDSACDAVGRMLERRLLGSPDLAVLERRRLEQINQERDLPGNIGAGALPASLVLLQMEIARAEDRNGNGVRGTLFLSDNAGQVLGKVTATIGTSVPGDLVDVLLPDLLEALKASPAAARSDRTNEAQRFLIESQFLRNDGDPPGALRAAEAAAALDPERPEIQIQLALCLGLRSREVLDQGNGDVKNSLPLAGRSVELCRRVRVEMLARGTRLDLKLDDAEEVLTASHGHARGYWEKVLALAAKQEPETKRRIADLQSQLREVKNRLHVQYVLTLATNGAGARTYCDDMFFPVQNAEKFAPSSEVWTEDIVMMTSQWLGVADTYPYGLGGWELGVTRPLARLACQANGCDEQGFAHGEWEVVGKVPRLHNWQLQPRDLEKLRGLFEQMEANRDSLLQCYGRIGRLALAVRGKAGLDEQTLPVYRSAKQFIYEQIAMPSPRKPEMTYHGLFYCAARDLIDIIPDPAARRREHVELFELMMKRRELVYHTVQMVCDPAACRFASYQKYPEPFPVDPAGHTPDAYPMLLANAQRTLQLFRAKDRQDVDAAKFAYLSGSFERDLSAMCNRIYEKRPDLATNAAGPVLWTKAPALFATPTNDRVRTVVVEGEYAFAIVGRSAAGRRETDCVRIPLDGKAPTVIATLPLTNGLPMSAVAVVADGTLYVAERGNAIYAVPITGGPAQTINRESGLLSSSVGAFTVAGGKVYAMLAEGRLVAYDLKSKQCETLASKKSNDKRSPLDEIAGGFDVLSMIYDAPRRRVLFTTQFGEHRNCFAPIGLWQLDIASGQIKQLLETYYPIRWMAFNDPDHLLLFAPRNEDDCPCHAAFYSVISCDLATDKTQLIWAFNRDRPAGPTLPIESVLVRRGMHAFPPFLVVGDWLWLVSEGHGRLSLKTKALEEFAPPEPTKSFGRPGWHTLVNLAGGKKIVAADDTHVWLLTLP